MKTAILIRHSKRDKIKNPKNHKEVLLNEEGKKIARNFGKELAIRFDSVKIFSSPVERCIQTGKCICEAFSKKTEIETSSMLGEPGPFVYGDAWESFEKLGTTGVVESLEKGIELPLIHSEAYGTKTLLDFIRTETCKCSENTAAVFVTHDACVAPVINFFTGEYFEKSHWIEFIGGLEIQFDEKSVYIKRLNGVE